MKLNQKTKSLLAISVAAIFSLTVVAVSTLPNAIADDDSKKLHFAKNPDFVSHDCIVTGFATANLSSEALAALDCNMQAWLDNKGTALQYQIQISGMELIDTDDDTQDDLYQLHIHKNTTGTTEDPKGPHQLNVYRGPAFDDADLIVLPVQGMLVGIWDDGDENLSYGEPDNSHKLTEDLQLLCDSQIFAAGHGDVEDVPGHHAPYIKMLLEPTSEGLKACKKLGF